jgi:hypothetical protein
MDDNTTPQPAEYDADKEAEAMWERAQAFIQSGEAQADPEPAEKIVEPATSEKVVEEAAKEQEPPAKDDDSPPEDFPKKSQATPEAITTWKDMKAELKQLREERDSLQRTLPEKDKTVQEKLIEIEQMKAKIAEFEGKDISAYERRISEMEAAMTEHEQFRAIHDIQHSKAYQSEVLEPAARIGQEVDILAKSNDVDPETLKSVLAISDPVEQRRRLREVTDGWSPIDAGELMAKARETQDLLRKSASMFENAEKAKQELSFLEQEKARKAKEDEDRQLQAATEAANKLIQEKIPFIKDNKTLLEAIQKAEIKRDPASLAVAARASVILPHLLRQLDERNAKISELEQSIKARSAATPRPTSTQTPVSTGDNLPTGYDFDSIMARFNAMQRG